MASESEWEAWRSLSDCALPAEWLGVDVGYVYPAADSDGRIYRWTHQRRVAGYAVGGDVTIRRADGRVSTRPAYSDSEMALVEARSMTDAFRVRIRSLAIRIVAAAADSGRGLVLEDWDDVKRRRSVWIPLYNSIVRIARERGVVVRTVQRAWTSVSCPECGHRDKGNRPTRDEFLCRACGHAGQADVVAANNMRIQATAVMSERLPVCRNGACSSEVIFRTGLCCACYFFERRRGRLPRDLDLEAMRTANNYRDFVRKLDKEAEIQRVLNRVAGEVAARRREAQRVAAQEREDRVLKAAVELAPTWPGRVYHS